VLFDLFGHACTVASHHSTAPGVVASDVGHVSTTARRRAALDLSAHGFCVATREAAPYPSQQVLFDLFGHACTVASHHRTAPGVVASDVVREPIGEVEGVADWDNSISVTASEGPGGALEEAIEISDGLGFCVASPETSQCVLLDLFGDASAVAQHGKALRPDASLARQPAAKVETVIE